MQFRLVATKISTRKFKCQIYNEVNKYCSVNRINEHTVRQSIEEGNPAHVPMSLPMSPDSDVATQLPFVCRI